jgi:hypothetical protein
MCKDLEEQAKKHSNTPYLQLTNFSSTFCLRFMQYLILEKKRTDMTDRSKKG